MTNQKWLKLTTALLIASLLLVGAVQRFDTIQAKKVIVTGSGGLVFGVNGGNLDLNAKQLILDDDADTILAASTDDQAILTLGAATGYFNVDTGNLKVGDATPTFTQTGEDMYVEGTFEAATDMVLGAQTSFSVTTGLPITPTGRYQPIISFAQPQTGGTSAIAAGTTVGEMLMLHNINASQVITIDGTGATVECKADVALAGGDILTLIWNGTDWNCVSNYDNS